jgi:hypothetical protein
MADEARHVAFGVLSLREVYADMSGGTAGVLGVLHECALRVRDRFLAQEAWETPGLSAKKCTEIMKRNPAQIDLRKALSKVVPSLKKLGLLDFSDGWLWKKLGELGVLKYEDLENASAEYPRMHLDHAPSSVIQYKHY